MTRTALILAVLLLAGCSTASAIAPTAWRPLPSSAFLPIDPLVRPIHVEPTLSAIPSATHRPQIATPRPLRTITPTTHSLTGRATWWDSWGHGFYAAAGPRLRAAMGPGYLHRYVTACARGQCVRVRLTTSCACQPDSRVIDLSLDAFSRLADPSLGVLEVSVSW